MPGSNNRTNQNFDLEYYERLNEQEKRKQQNIKPSFAEPKFQSPMGVISENPEIKLSNLSQSQMTNQGNRNSQGNKVEAPVPLKKVESNKFQPEIGGQNIPSRQQNKSPETFAFDQRQSSGIGGM